MFDAATLSKLPPALPSYDGSATTIAIIGAGFSGTLLALHLLRRCPVGTRVILIERSGQHGPGLAYATQNPGHRLNVPAGKMSAFHDRPLDFLQFLTQRPQAGNGAEAPNAGAFVPRGEFGAYIRSLLREAAQDPTVGQHLFLAHDDIIGLDRGTDRLVLRGLHGARIEADLAVLAIGNLPPSPLPLADDSFFQTQFYRHSPWAPDALTGLDRDAPVLLLGAGLTMVDTAVALLDQGHRGTIHAVSRRGLLPHSHKPVPPIPLPNSPYPTRALALMRLLRRQAREVEAAGGDWRGVVDALRPFTTDLWQAFPLEERQRFLRHLRPWWDIHRHRMAGAVADRINTACAQRRIQIHAGRLQALGVAAGQAVATIRTRGAAATTAVHAARVINCTGPGTDCRRLTDRLLQSLFCDGAVRPDALGLSVDVTPTGAVRKADGAVSRQIFAVGPMTRGAFWEMTAVPDIRRQCETLAQHLAGLVKMPAPQVVERSTRAPI
jgi:uncharacterized NAD(P)/FAD-binding protein YdhS